MPSVDNRVVRMRFDNKDFGSGVDESIRSLDKLKSALDFKDAAKGFDEIGHAAEKCQGKLSSFEVFGQQIIRNIANDVYSLKNKFVDLIESMSIDQVTEGWKKYGDKTSSVQTILNSTGQSIDEVNVQLDRLMKYSDETSFGFTDMTAALQTMTASGGDLETLIPMLMGIGNATAFAGKGAAEFSRVMYNLNQAYSMGYLGTMDWKSVQMAGVGSKQLKQALLDSARILGTGNYSLDQFQTALTKKAFTTEVMEDAFSKFAKVTLEAEKLVSGKVFETFSEAYDYLQDQFMATGDAYDELGYKAARAAQEAKTFSEAIEATKDAVSSGWMDTFEQLFGNYEEAKVNWTWLANELWDVFASGAESRNNMLKEWKAKGGFDLLWLGIRNLWNGLRGFGDRISQAWSSLFSGIDADKLYEWTEKFVVFSGKVRNFLAPAADALEEFADKTDKAKTKLVSVFGVGDYEVVENITDDVEELADTTDEYVNRLVKTLKELPQLEQKVWAGQYSIGEERRRMLEDEGYSYELVQNKINEAAGSSAQLAIDENKLRIAQKILNGELTTGEKKTDKAADSVEDLGDAAKTTRNWTSDLKDVVVALKDGLNLLIDAAKLVAKYIVIPAGQKAFSIFKKILSVVAEVSRGFSNFVAKLRESKTVTKNIENLQQWFSNLFGYLREKENFQKFLEYLERFRTWVSGLKTKAIEKILGFFDKLAELEIKLPPVESIGDWIDSAFGWVNKALEKVDQIDGVFNKISEFAKGLDFSEVGKFASSLASNIATFLKEFFTNEDLKEAGEAMITGIYEGAKKAIQKIDWGGLFSLGLKTAALIPLIRLANAFRFFINGLTKMTKTPFTLVANLSSVLSAFTKTLKARQLLLISISIGILTASIIALSKADIPVDKITSIAVAISAVMLALGVILRALGMGSSNTTVGDTNMTAFSGNFKENNATIKLVNDLAAILIALGIAVLSVAVAAKMISKVSNRDLIAVGAVIGVLLVVAIALMAVTSKLAKANTDHNKFSNELLKVAASFVILSIAMDLMVPAIAALVGLSLVNKGKALALAIGAIVLIMGALAGLTAVAKKADTKSSNIIVVASSLVVLAIALNIMAPAIASLTAIAALNPKAAIGVGIFILALMGMLIGLAAVSKKSSNTTSSILAVAGAFAIFALAVNILTPALATLTLMAALKPGALIGVMVGLLLTMTIFALIFSKLSEIDDEEAKNGIKAILVLSLAIATIGAVLAVLKGASFKELMTIVGAIGIFAAIIMVLGIIAQAIPGVDVALYALGLALAAVGVGFLAAGAGALLMSAAIKQFADDSIDFKKAGKNMAEGIIAFFDELVKNGNSILVFIGRIIELILGVLVAKKAKIVGVGADIVKAFGDRIVTLIGGMKGKIVFVLAILLLAVMDFFGLQIDTVIDYILLLIVKIINGISKALISNSGHIMAAIWNLGKALIHLAMKVIGMLLEGIQEILNYFGIEAHFADKFNEWADAEGQAALEAIDREDKVITEKMNKDKEEMLAAAQIFKDSSEQAAGLISSGANNYKQAILSAKSTDTVTFRGTEFSGDSLAWLQSMIASGQIQVEASDFGEETADNYIEGFLGKFMSGEVDATDDLHNWTDMVNAETATGLGEASPSKITEEYAENYIQGFDNGIKGNLGLTRPSINKLIRGINDQFMSILENAFKIGQNFVQGFSNGIQAYSYLADQQAYQLGKTAYRSLKKSLDMNSPSKETEEAGMFFDNGFANGIDNNTGMVIDSVDSMSEETLAAFNAVIARIQDAINGEWDVSPVIRPVLDLSEIQNGQGRIASILGTNARYGFSPDLSYSRMQANNVQASMNTYTGRDILMAETMASMQTQIGELTAQNQTMMMLLREYMPYIPQVANMKMVTDRGALVGELAPLMNEKLGIIAAKNRKR